MTPKNPWLRGCGKWKRDALGIRVERQCGDVVAEVERLGRHRFWWGIYVPGQPGTWSSGRADSSVLAKAGAEAALVRYAKR